MDNVEHFYAPNRENWHKWLDENHDTESAIWLVFDKGKNRTMSWQDIVEEALCYGWIDSRPGKVSDTQSKLYITKRKPKSVWSKINKLSAERLIKEGRMQPAGMASVDVAKRNGSWNALELSDNLIIPSELSLLFNSNKTAKNNFDSFPVGTRKNTLQWIYDAKTEPTRLRRIEQTFEAAKLNTRLR